MQRHLKSNVKYAIDPMSGRNSERNWRVINFYLSLPKKSLAKAAAYGKVCRSKAGQILVRYNESKRLQTQGVVLLRDKESFAQKAVELYKAGMYVGQIADEMGLPLKKIIKILKQRKAIRYAKKPLQFDNASPETKDSLKAEIKTLRDNGKNEVEIADETKLFVPTAQYFLEIIETKAYQKELIKNTETKIGRQIQELVDKGQPSEEITKELQLPPGAWIAVELNGKIVDYMVRKEFLLVLLGLSAKPRIPKDVKAQKQGELNRLVNEMISAGKTPSEVRDELGLPLGSIYRIKKGFAVDGRVARAKVIESWRSSAQAMG